MSKKQMRIFLWAVPRSISTAFLRAMMNRKNIKVLNEPYSRPYHFGPNRVSSRYGSEPIIDEDKFENTRDLCEQPYPDADEVFVKDMARFLVDQPDYINLVPTGYIHTFIIRTPAKAIPSFYKACANKELTGWDHFNSNEVGFKELYQMFELVTKTLGQDAIIVDADDLVAHPEYILRQYCTRVGIEFQQSMVDWEDDPRHNDIVCKDWPAGWFTHALNSKRFAPSNAKLPSSLAMPTLPDIVQESIDESMPYYHRMYNLRIMPVVL